MAAAMHVAVLGLGSAGMRHARNLLALGCTVTGFDPDERRAALLAACGGETAATRDAALAGAQAAVIASPNAAHRDDLGAAVSAGCPAFVEKPFAHATAGVAEILDEADSRNLVVAAAHNLRFHPAVEKAKEIIRSGRSDELLWAEFVCASYLPDWRPDQDYAQGYASDPETGGVIFDIVHEFDLAAHLLGPLEAEDAVARRTGQLDIAAEDCADIRLRHPGGAAVSLHLDYVTRPPVRRALVCGTRGRIELDLIARTCVFSPVEGKVDEEAFGGGIDDDYREEARNFLAAVAGEEPPGCSGREALAVLEQVVRARALAGLPSAG